MHKHPVFSSMMTNILFFFNEQNYELKVKYERSRFNSFVCQT